MTLNDPLSNVLSNILNAEKVGKKEYTANISSKMILKVLGIMRDNRYIGEFKETEYGNKSRIHINLLGKINNLLKEKDIPLHQ